jgi:predicted dehydrogenase
MKRGDLGIAVIGSGRIGTLRARLAAKHPSVRFLAVSDKDPARAKALAEVSGANLHSADNDAIIAHPDVTAVIVSTPEQQHTAPILKALELGKPVLVEKPIGFSLPMPTRFSDAPPHQRQSPRRLQPPLQGVLPARQGADAPRPARQGRGRHRAGLQFAAQAFAILKRDPHATPVIDVLTYYVDLMCWFLEGNRPVEVVARGQHGIFKEAGYSAHDVTWAIVTFADGAVVNLGVSYALPAGYPTLGQSDRVELLGTEGTMIIDDDHLDHLCIPRRACRTPTCPTTA